MTELHLYQTVHVADERPRLVRAHAALLAEAARTFFGCDYAPDVRLLESRIAALVRSERYPRSVSSFVRIEVSDNGTERLRPAGYSLYNGYALRSVMPDARVVRCEVPGIELPTSGREALHRLADRRARALGADLAVRADLHGVCYSADSAPLFAVRNNTVFTSPELVSDSGDPAPPPFEATSARAVSTAVPPEPREPNAGPAHPELFVQSPAAPAFRSVERETAAHAIRTAGLTLREEPILQSELATYDELFYVDHRGITALAHCDGAPYMFLVAERIAEAMEGMF